MLANFDSTAGSTTFAGIPEGNTVTAVVVLIKSAGPDGHVTLECGANTGVSAFDRNALIREMAAAVERAAIAKLVTQKVAAVVG